jgi:hypothetical protein
VVGCFGDVVGYQCFGVPKYWYPTISLDSMITQKTMTSVVEDIWFLVSCRRQFCILVIHCSGSSIEVTVIPQLTCYYFLFQNVAKL